MNSTWAAELDDFAAPPYQLVASPSSYPFYYAPRASLLSWISDKDLSLLVPVVVYWAASLVFHLIDVSGLPFFERHRIHEPEEITKRNRVTVKAVIVAVAFQHAIQTALGLYWLDEAEAVKEAFADHNAALQRYAVWVSRAAFAALGPKYGTRALRSCGAEVTSWLYWWGVPIVQFFFAR